MSERCDFAEDGSACFVADGDCALSDGACAGCNYRPAEAESLVLGPRARKFLGWAMLAKRSEGGILLPDGNNLAQWLREFADIMYDESGIGWEQYT